MIIGLEMDKFIERRKQADMIESLKKAIESTKQTLERLEKMKANAEAEMNK